VHTITTTTTSMSLTIINNLGSRGAMAKMPKHFLIIETGGELFT
jgi:hypothetical protein